MSAPVKPWETGLNRMSLSRPILESSLTCDRPMPVGALQAPSIPPPLPARRPNLNTAYGHQGYSNPMYRYGGYNSYMGYNPYGYNPFGRRMMGMGMMPDDYDSRMMQAAEESCQALFGPLDSLVRSVSSIAMVLDSTMQAMQMSFRTVVSAADSLSRLKSMAVELASGLSLFTVIGNFFRRLFRMLGLIKGAGPAEKEWAAAAAKAAAGAAALGAPGVKTGQSAWPAVAFFALMMGGPYLMFRMFSQLPPTAQAGLNGWTPTANDSVNVTALYDFEGTGSGEFSFRKGDRLYMKIGSSTNGWVLVSDGSRSGFVPGNRLVKQVKGKSSARQVFMSEVAEPQQIATSTVLPKSTAQETSETCPAPESSAPVESPSSRSTS